jgi:hypothetical protein
MSALHKRTFIDDVSAQPKGPRDVQPDGLVSFEIHNEFEFRQADRRACALKAPQPWAS